MKGLLRTHRILVSALAVMALGTLALVGCNDITPAQLNELVQTNTVLANPVTQADPGFAQAVAAAIVPTFTNDQGAPLPGNLITTVLPSVTTTTVTGGATPVSITLQKVNPALPAGMRITVQTTGGPYTALVPMANVGTNAVQTTQSIALPEGPVTMALENCTLQFGSGAAMSRAIQNVNISKLTVKYLNKGTGVAATWTAPTSFNLTLEKSGNLYILKNSSLELNWNVAAATVELPAKAVATVGFITNNVKTATIGPRTYAINAANKSVVIEGAASVTFDSLEVDIDLTQP